MRRCLRLSADKADVLEMVLGPAAIIAQSVDLDSALCSHKVGAEGGT
jgi:hypothetical protein